MPLPLDSRLNLVALVGPNGSGKSTFFRRFLAKWNLPFVNPDEIAKQLGLADPTQAAFRAFREATKRRNQLLADGRSFVTEGIRPDPGFLKEAAAKGWFTRVLFVCTNAPAINIDRVAYRVEHGGHHVDPKAVEARYYRSLESLPEAAAIASQLILFDNTARSQPHRFIARFQSGGLVSLRRNPPAWAIGVFAKEFEAFRAAASSSQP